jgi:hypothetical protein
MNHTQYLIALTVEALLLAGLVAAIVAVVVIRRRERRQRQAYRADQRARRAAGQIVAVVAPLEHEGATEAYADQLAVQRTVLAELADVPIVDDSDTGAAILRVRRHVDDILVAIAGDDLQLLAVCRAKADVTGQWDGRGLWALLAAEDAEAQLVEAGAR